MIKVLVVDDERNIQKAYHADIMAASDRYEMVDAIANAADALMICSAKRVDLILMDVNTARNESGLEATVKIKKNFPGIKVIITTSYTDPRALEEAKAAGADSFWFKDFSPVELLEVMDLTLAGKNYWPKEAPEVPLGDTTTKSLTDTEKEVLHWLVECVSVKKIAEKMFVEESTVKTHLQNIYNKVGCKSKTELLVMILQAKLVLPQKSN